MRKMHVLMLLIMLVIILPSQSVAGYGWGYKKNDEHKIPDVGKYERILKMYDGYFVEHSGEKNIYLTFDNGYEQGYTEDILDVLKKEDIPATFFVTGHYVKSAPNLVKRMFKDGHIIGNHSYTHPDFTVMTEKEVQQELEGLENAVQETIEANYKMQYLRPPRGTFNEETLKWTADLGYSHVFWSIAFQDWETNKQKGWKYAYDEVMNQIHPGAIILLHAVSSDNTEALEQIIKDLKKQGYTFRSLDYLVFRDKTPDFINW